MNKEKDKKAVTVVEKKSILAKMGAKFSVDGAVLQKTLSETVFKGATQEQTVALLIVADQYGLNPFTREIYAFPGKGGGIVPVIGIDGWLRIINEHPQFDGMECEQDDQECTCTIYRKDRTKPVIITEFLEECTRATDNWKNMPRRMLRHKTIIQCARVAFGFVGIHDEEDGKIIAEAEYSEVKAPIAMPEEIPAQAAPEKATPEMTPEQQGFVDKL